MVIFGKEYLSYPSFKTEKLPMFLLTRCSISDQSLISVLFGILSLIRSLEKSLQRGFTRSFIHLQGIAYNSCLFVFSSSCKFKLPSFYFDVIYNEISLFLSSIQSLSTFYRNSLNNNSEQCISISNSTKAKYFHGNHGRKGIPCVTCHSE